MQYTFSAHLCQSCSTWRHPTHLCPSDAWWESSDFSHQHQTRHVPTCHLSEARISTLLDPLTSLHSLSSYCICHIYIIGGGWACVCVRVGVSEGKLKKRLPLPVLIPSAVFFNYRLVHKLLLELVVEHLQASPSLKMNIANAHWKTNAFPENINRATQCASVSYSKQENW